MLTFKVRREKILEIRVLRGSKSGRNNREDILSLGGTVECSRDVDDDAREERYWCLSREGKKRSVMGKYSRNGDENIGNMCLVEVFFYCQMHL